MSKPTDPDRKPTAAENKEARELCFAHMDDEESMAVMYWDMLRLIWARNDANRRAEQAEAERVTMQSTLDSELDNACGRIMAVEAKNTRLVGLLSEVATYFPPECHCDDGICRACAWSDKVHDVLAAREGKTEDGE